MSLLSTATPIWKDDRTIRAPELMSAAGANALAARLAKYWRKQNRGEVRFWIETTSNAVSSRDVLHMVRSDLLNALPRAKR